ncbi:MAG: anaerobic carbon-monoxide dehydrogenase catalytic subunit [Deltaproteobacteria bacterium]|nr:anaerobic carbon-monoxide dehydrogenase catalytic subunit [Candidatus Tharpella aukensis]
MQISEAVKSKSVDPASREILQLAADQGLETVWDRLEKQQPQCGFGELGLCCRICAMGPCRIDPFGEGAQKGACGATADTIIARHLVRMIAAGAAAHSDHGRRPALLLKEIAEGRNQEYTITDPKKLKAIAARLGLESENCDIKELALKVATIALNDFGKQEEDTLAFVKAYAPKKRLERWQKIADDLSALSNKTIGILPRGIDREIVDIMHRTHFGVDHGPLSLIAQGVRAAIGDGWGGSLIATEIQDVIFGTPKIREATANLGVLDKEQVNIVIHGHEPVLSEKIVEIASSKEMQKLAQKKGAKGVNIVGICCSGNEILMRHGVPIAGNELQQELAIITGAVELMSVDVQCIFPALAELSQCFHTHFVATSDQAAFPGSIHIQFEEDKANACAEKIVTMAIENFVNRKPEKVYIPEITSQAMVGFSVEAILEALGGTPDPLLDAIKSGAIKGVVGIVGCNNPKVTHDFYHVELAKALIAKDILVIGSGCWAIAAAKAGLMQVETAKAAGPGLQQVCEALKIPPCLHMGSCVDCSRMLVLAGALADTLGVDIDDLPLVGSAPEWLTEKAISIGTFFVASGVSVHLWPMPPIAGGAQVTKILTETAKEVFGGAFFVEEDPLQAAEKMAEIIAEKRLALGLAN